MTGGNIIGKERKGEWREKALIIGERGNGREEEIIRRGVKRNKRGKLCTLIKYTIRKSKCNHNDYAEMQQSLHITWQCVPKCKNCTLRGT